MLEEYCFDCHGDGAHRGNVSFDTFETDAALLGNQELWWKVLKNVRAGLMPPFRKPQPPAPLKKRIAGWIKADVFRSDPTDPDPGRITLNRLNRAEYANTIRDLLGVEFDAGGAFPPDDSGYGFDNIGDVLTLSPMLLEKYLAAAREVVERAVPAIGKIPADHVLRGRSFLKGDADPGEDADPRPGGRGSLILSYYKGVSVTNRYPAAHGGTYRLVIDGSANERYVDNQFDFNRCRLIFRVDGKKVLQREYAREGGKTLHEEWGQTWAAGDHELVFEVVPLTPDQPRVRSLNLRIDSVTVRGPLEETYWVHPPDYTRFFSREVPEDADGRRQYAREILESFLLRAYRRPADAGTVERLVALAGDTYNQPGKTFEAGIRQAMIAILASPRFLFREEAIDGDQEDRHYPLVDEYSLASRLSYFLWSSMPDEELLRLAKNHDLRAHLNEQTGRMLDDPRSSAFVENFVGQWLETRDIESIQIDARQVLGREEKADPDRERRRKRFFELREKSEEELTPAEKAELADIRASLFRRFRRAPRAEMTGDLRRAMRLETEKTFEYVLRQDRPLLELIDGGYTFLNEALARHYGLTNLGVRGDAMRRVELPADCPRGGILTQGSVLAVTSNPTRTSPVKRGLFILDNLLGTPPPPPPANITPLEDAAKGITNRTVSLRETLALHREQPLCSSCHNRMDPLGLAFENFNAMGMWRAAEQGLSIDATGTLLTGESFTNVTQLKRILATRHATEFYRTVTEKLLTYALGRGLETYDVATVDAIVERLQASGGRPSEWIAGVIESAPFQKTRRRPSLSHAEPGNTARSPRQHAATGTPHPVPSL